jgi:hypothetical protein
LLATDSDRTWIRPMVGGYWQVSQMREDKAKAATDSHGSAQIERRASTQPRVMFNFSLFCDLVRW